MRGKGKYFLVLLFLLIGLGVYTFANPAGDDTVDGSNGDGSEIVDPNQDDDDTNNGDDGDDTTQNGEGGDEGNQAGGNDDQLIEYDWVTEIITGEEQLVHLSWLPHVLKAMKFNSSGEETGRVTLTKIIDDADLLDLSDEQKAKLKPNRDFTLNITGTTSQNVAIDTSVVVNPSVGGIQFDLPYGTYKISEVVDGYYSFLDFALTYSDNSVVKISDVNELEFSITNEGKEALIKVTNDFSDMDVDKVVDEDIVYLLDTVNYTITLTNTGKSGLISPVITDQLTDNQVFGSLTSVSVLLNGELVPTLLDGTKYTFTELNGVITVTFDSTVSLNHGDKIIVKYSTTVNDDVEQDDIVGNNVIATSDNVLIDKTDKVEIPVEEYIDITVTKTNNPLESVLVYPGDKIKYMVTVTNSDNAQARNVVITDTLTGKISYVANSLVVKVNGEPIAVAQMDITLKTFSVVIPTLEAEDVVTLTYEVSVDADAAQGTTVSNKVVVTANNMVGSKEDTTTNTIENEGDVDVDKEGDKTVVYKTDVINYTVTLTNTGDSILKNPVVTDTLANNLTFASLTSVKINGTSISTYTIDTTTTPGVIIIKLPSMAVGAIAEIKYVVSVNDDVEQDDVVYNDVVVTADNVTVDKTDREEAIVEELTTIELVKTNNPGSTAKVYPGDIIEYTVTATNGSIAKARNVIITDTLTGMINYTGTSDVVVRVDGKIITPTVNIVGKVLTVTIAEVEVDAVVTITYKVRVDETATQDAVVSNRAVVTADNMDGSDEDTTTNTIENEATITVVKSSVKSSYKAGDSISYTITVTNTGSKTAKNVIVTDTLPTSGLTNIGYTASEVKSYSNGVIEFNPFDLAVGATKTFTITAKIVDDIEDGTSIRNAVVAKGGNTDEVTDSETDEIVNDPNITITKSNTPNKDTKVKAEDEITYTIRVENTGNGVANNVKVSDVIPTNTTLVAGSISVSGTLNSGTITWNIGTLSAGASKEVTFKVKVNANVADKTIIKNSATVEFRNPNKTTDDTIPSNEVENTVAGPIISGSKNSNITKHEVIRGQEITYTITVNNTGTGNATGIVVTDTVPAKTSLVAGSISDSGVLSSGTITWTVDVAAGASKTLTFKVKVDEVITEATTIRNAAIVNGTITNEVVETVLLPKIEYNKSANKSDQNGIIVRKGDIITYYINLSNTGKAVSDAFIVTDAIPAKTTLVAGSISHGGTESNGTITWNVDPMAAGSSKTLSFEVKVGDAKIGDKIKNKAFVDDKPTNEVITYVEGKIDVTIKKLSTKATNIVLILDLSSSMIDRVGGVRKIDSAKEVVKQFVNNIFANGGGDGVEITIVGFHTVEVNYPTLASITKDNYNKGIFEAELAKVIAGDNVNNSGYGTHIYKGLTNGYAKINALKTKNPKNSNVVIFLGDGVPTPTNQSGGEFTTNSNSNILSMATNIKSIATMYTIGFDVANSTSAKDLLRSMATSAAHAYLSDNGAELVNNFDSITTSIQTETPTMYSENGIVTFDVELIFNSKYPTTLIIGGTTYVIDEESDLATLPMGFVYNKTTKKFVWDLNTWQSEISLSITYYVN